MDIGFFIAGAFWLLALVWMAYEVWRAPLLDEDYRPISDAEVNCEQYQDAARAG